VQEHAVRLYSAIVLVYVREYLSLFIEFHLGEKDMVPRCVLWAEVVFSDLVVSMVMVWVWLVVSCQEVLEGIILRE